MSLRPFLTKQCFLNGEMTCRSIFTAAPLRTVRLTSSILNVRHRNYRSRIRSRAFLDRFMYNQYLETCRKMSTQLFAGKEKDLIFRQLLEYKSFTYTYLLADPDTKEAILIDPVIETVERDVKLVKDMGLNLIYGVNTHVHADHITGTGMIKDKIPTCKSVISEVSRAHADIKLKHGDKIKFGKYELEARSTPGHTGGNQILDLPKLKTFADDKFIIAQTMGFGFYRTENIVETGNHTGCMTFVLHEKGMAFTGDVLLIRGCGRTDFQEGDSSQLYESVHQQIFSLDPDYRLYPAHDYTGQTHTTVEEERNYNPRLSKKKEEFIKIMANLNLPYPKQIDKALPANLVCGIQSLMDSTKS